MKLVNLTPHPLTFEGIGGKYLTIHPSGIATRVDTVTQRVDIVSELDVEIPVNKVRYTNIVNLPGPEEGTIFIASSIVAMTANRKDVVSPDTSRDSSIRDNFGRIVAVKALQTFNG